MVSLTLTLQIFFYCLMQLFMHNCFSNQRHKGSFSIVNILCLSSMHMKPIYIYIYLYIYELYYLQTFWSTVMSSSSHATIQNTYIIFSLLTNSLDF